MGQSQASHSLQSITDPHAPATSGERKISFVLQDNESNESGEKAHVSLYFDLARFLYWLTLTTGMFVNSTGGR